MAKIARALQKLFGSTGAATEFGVFGSDSEGAAATSKDPAVIQSLATFLRGLYGSTANAAQPPRIEDMNALFYLFARQIAYGFQAGVPEWLATENYYANASVVLGSNGKIYISKTGTDGSPNINNNPTTDTGTNWRYVWTNDVFSAFPLSDLSRVMAMNGDGIPMFPDNVAGRTYVPNFATTDSWGTNNSTLSVANNILKATASTSTLYGTTRSISAINTKMFRFRIKTSRSTTVNAKYYNGSVFPVISSVQTVAGVWTYLDGYLAAGSTNSQIYIDTFINATAGDTLEISQENTYIGTGLYDTPVYDKACCNRATNKGVLPVPGPRGLAMLFNKQSSLVFDNPVVGRTGTIGFRFKRNSIGTEQYIFDNITGTTSGFNLRFNSSNVIRLGIYNGTGYSYGNSVITDTTSWHSFVMPFNGTAIIYYIDGVPVETISSPQLMSLATAVLKIGADGTGFDGLIAEPFYRANYFTQDDVTRYNNGDDMVDSQQKAVTPVPHSIVTRGANGEINASNMFAYDIVIDSDAKLAQWAASGTWENVLIKKGTWTLASGGVDLTARGTKLVIGEPGSKLVFSSVMKGLYYTSLPTTKDYRMNGVTVECTGTGTEVYGFANCTNLTNCTGTGTGTGARGYGFVFCTNLTNCTGTGTRTEVYGFANCTNLTNCTGTGTGGFSDCKKMQQNTATGSTAKYISSYADAGTAYPCADTPNGGFNS